METRAHHVLIGLFTLIVVTGTLLFGLWLAKASTDRAFHDYEVVFKEGVAGLSQGSAVQYNGIRVGDVSQLKLDPTDPRRVLARIRLASDAPVKQDTHAKLALTGITGTSVIQLSGGSPQSPPLRGKDGQLPRIVADPSSLTRLLANSEDLMININDTVARASQILSDENLQHVQSILSNLNQTTDILAGERGDIRQLVQQLTLATRQANATLAQTEQLTHNANQLIDTQGRAAADSLQTAMASLERSTATIDQLLNDNHGALDSGLRGLADIGPVLIELRKTLDSMHSITRKLNEDPARYLLGRDKTKEFKP